MAELESLRHLRVTLLFTYSGITDPRIEPIAKSRITVTSISTACGRKQRTGVVLYWRPIVPGWNDQPATMAHVLHTGRHADAIVFTGYYHKPENTAYLRAQGVPLPYGEQDYHRRKTMPADLDAAVVGCLARLRHQHTAVPQDILRRCLRPRCARLQRPLGRARDLRHLPRCPAAALR